MEDDSMINMPNLVFDEKVIGNKRVRDGEEDEELHQAGRLEKRPSGIILAGGGDGDGDDDVGGGIIDTLISNVFHKNTEGHELVEAVGGEDQDKREDLGSGEGGGGGGVISAFFSNIFHHNGSADDDGDHLVDEVAEKTEYYGGGDGDKGEPVDLNTEKLPEKKDDVVDLPSKDTTGPTLNKMKPDDYAERVFFLNNN